MRTPPRSYEFGRFRVDAEERVLLYDGSEVALTQKAFEVLLALVERGGHVVSKEELIRKVWSEQFVDEGNLTQNVYMLRKILGETEGGQQYIETVPRRGYRFKPRVEVSEQDDAGAAQAATRAGAGVGEGKAAAPARTTSAAEPFVQPKTSYARSGDLHIAYQVVGDGPLDLVLIPGMATHVEFAWENPDYAHFLRRLAAFS
ncbi:MAG TPA: transcriptional regulator, partial [Pyrinomonadaceae bacterium]